MLDEYLALGGVELGNNARALAYSRCLPCCAGLLKGGACASIHDATNPVTNAVREWQEQGRNRIPDPRGITPATTWASVGATPATLPDGGVLFTLAVGTFRVGPEVLVAASTQYTVSLSISSDLARTVDIVYRPNIASATGEVVIAAGVSLSAGLPNEFTATFTTSATAPSPTAAAIFATGANASANRIMTVTEPVLVTGAIAMPYFDGQTLPEGSNSVENRVSWTGTANASVSLWERNVIITPASSSEPPYDCSVIDRAPWYDPDNEFSHDLAGFYLLRVSGITDGTMTAGVTESIDNGGVIGAARYASRSVRVRTMILGCGNAAAEYGLAWLKAALGEQFCARHGDACGTSDLEFFIDCPPSLDPGDTDYAATTARYRRYLHGVGCTSAPIIAEEYATPSGAYVIVVEYILTAESPFVWGQTLPGASTGSVLTAYDDIPFNLMRHPSGEVGDGIPAITATQYVFNGSVEYGATGWANAVTNIPAGITAGASTDIAAVGPNSYRVRLLATGAVAAGEISTYYDVALGALPGGSRPSLSVWAAALTFAGAPTLDPALTAEVEWRNGGTVLGTTPLGSIPVNGGNASATGLTVPATATTARLRVRATNITAAAADDLRVYADAFSLTVP
ncbi:minor tail protein [Microbacterium phage Nicole72]|uniref:Minor tail protein n=1 Tax=Microbacterium phage Nicole72 TaxID=3062838 RepID=A0ACD4UHM6_9CAUD|nr:minor tail protein [Microbacterium phage Nicole72]